MRRIWYKGLIAAFLIALSCYFVMTGKLPIKPMHDRQDAGIEIGAYQPTEQERERFSRGDLCPQTEERPLTDVEVLGRLDENSGVHFSVRFHGAGFLFEAARENVGVELRSDISRTLVRVTTVLHRVPGGSGRLTRIVSGYTVLVVTDSGYVQWSDFLNGNDPPKDVVPRWLRY